MASNNQRSKCCFDEWLKTQEQQLSELLEAQNRQENEVESQLPDIILNGLVNRGNLAKISPNQLRKINDLHMKTIREEERLSNELASLQENIADQPIAMIAKMMSGVGESSSEIDRALDQHETALANIMQEVDKLRLSTLKELLGILTPVQGVDILAAGKKLHLCIHQWCKTRDQKHGRN
ncbi:hypothetical protein CCACVL1_15834 [Corchorus capsularis]|uniref:DOG1 domain-containing protein n=1 Tax=Corchorus capsularis TaxID=210143 RepID=A0A1R3I145_COCAP|nr:hypothetical protein CCACVL1_15834 [Corchorus capsularis]